MTKLWRRLFASSTLPLVLAASGSALAADDPYLQWWTIQTPHARVHYYKGLEPIAERVADVLEGVYGEMTSEMGWEPTQITEVVLTDNTDSANGSATAIPYDAVWLFVTAPDDMSALGDYDDWYLELVSHEYTHILHTDNITGAPAVINAVMGRTLVPNQSQPRWLLEGLAVVEESRHTTGGRIRSTMFDMFLRADVLDDRIVPLDQMSNSVRRWPQGNIWYLYGSRFLSWIADLYGPTVLAAVARDSGAQIIPFGLNRSIQRATGSTYVELYKSWVEWLRKTTAAQMAEVDARGRREGVRLTRAGQQVSRPRFVPAVARTTPGYAELIYQQSSDDRTGWYRFVLDAPQRVRPGSEQLVVRATGPGSASFEPDGGLIFSSADISRRVYSFGELMRLPRGAMAPSGMESAIQRLTEGARAHDPDVSPDGRSVVYTVTHRGTSYLKIASITPEGAIAGVRTLAPSARFEQAYTPRYAPDGREVAYSAWTRGGFRDIRIVDPSTGDVRELMHDRAMDMQPSYSPDGRWLLYSSDRTGIANVYAYDRSSRQTYQVTNVRTGAFQPELSPDGRTLVYVGYTSEGFDLFSMPFEPATFLAAEPSRIERVDGPRLFPQHSYVKTPYNPLPSLRPRNFTLRYGPGTYGQALTIQTQGSDAVGHHSFAGSMNIETDEPVPYASLSYVYGRLPFNYFSTLFRSVAPRHGYVVSEQEPIWLETTWGWTNGVAYTRPRGYDSQTYALSYSIAHIDGELPVGAALDPYALVGHDPLRGYVGTLRLAWAYSNAEQYVNSVGPERGFSLSTTMDVGNELTASQFDIYAFGYNATKYTPMPWARHHTLAMHIGGATATGNYPRRGLYYVGGFSDTRLQDQLYETVFQSAYVLRGYKPVSFIGTQYHLANVEYRFPIVNVDHGISTVPIFLQRISGNAFVDYGGSFNQLDVSNWRGQLHTGVGGELWIDVQLGYHMLLNIRAGYAKGFGVYAEEGGQKYLVLAAPF